MSLFDVIRYPIDNRFLIEDLERIPVEILNECWDEISEERAHLRDNKVNPNMSKDLLIEHRSYYATHIMSSWWSNELLERIKARIKAYEPI